MTREHVFPRMLFKDKHFQMLTVPGCSDCQRKKQPGEIDLWVYVNTDILGSLHPDAVHHADEIVDSSDRRAAWLARELQKEDYVALRDDEENIRGIGHQIGFNFSRIETTMEMIVRALYFVETGAILPNTTAMDVLIIPWNHFTSFMRNISRLPTLEPRVFGEKVVWYIPMFPVDAPKDSSVWVLCFNDHVAFQVATGTAAEDQKSRRREGQRKIDQMKQLGYLVGPMRPHGIRLPKDRRGRLFIPPS